MSRQAAVYAVQAVAAGGLWVAIGACARQLWNRTHRGRRD